MRNAQDVRAGIERLGFSECYKEGRAHCRELYGSLVSVVGTGMIACWCSLSVTTPCPHRVSMSVVAVSVLPWGGWVAVLSTS